MSYPTKDRVSFLVAEDIRQEANGKISLLGVFTGGDVLVVGDPAQATLKLIFLWVFENGEGKYKAQITLTAPSGKRLFESPEVDIDKGANTNATFAIVFAHVGFEEGVYTATMHLDNETYPRAFRIGRAPLGDALGGPT